MSAIQVPTRSTLPVTCSLGCAINTVKEKTSNEQGQPAGVHQQATTLALPEHIRLSHAQLAAEPKVWQAAEVRLQTPAQAQDQVASEGRVTAGTADEQLLGIFRSARSCSAAAQQEAVEQLVLSIADGM